jgi:hypothetical protein
MNLHLSKQGKWKIDIELVMHVFNLLNYRFQIMSFLSLFFVGGEGEGGGLDFDIYPLDYEQKLNTSVIKPAIFELNVINVQPQTCISLQDFCCHTLTIQFLYAYWSRCHKTVWKHFLQQYSENISSN